MQNSELFKIPQALVDTSRVWIYQSNVFLNEDLVVEIQKLLDGFIDQWKSHGYPVNGYATVLYNHFIAVVADERKVTVGGCSTDASVRAVMEIGKRFDIDFFNRTSMAFLIDGRVLTIELDDLENAIQNRLVENSTLYFNNLVETKKDFIENWLVPVSDSWLAKRYDFRPFQAILE